MTSEWHNCDNTYAYLVGWPFIIFSRLISSAGFLDVMIANFAFGLGLSLDGDVDVVPDVSALMRVGDRWPSSDGAHSISLSEPADAILLGDNYKHVWLGYKIHK
jgi:hypothetical protein